MQNGNEISRIYRDNNRCIENQLAIDSEIDQNLVVGLQIGTRADRLEALK